MLHVMGAHHEMSLPSRHDHIDIDWNCIQKGARVNFQLESSVDDTEYDLESMMQYNPNLFRDCIVGGKYDNKTMRAKDERFDFLMYRLVHQPTHSDIKAISKAYGCEEGCTDDCLYGGFITTTVNNPDCHCVCPKYFSGSQCTDRLNADVCGSHTFVDVNNPRIVKSTGYDAGFYLLDLECVYLFTSPPGTIIMLDFLDLKLTVTDAEISTCVHFLEVRTNLMGQDGPEECGSTTNLTYTTSKNSESNMAVLILNSLRPGSPSRGFMVKASAIISECVTEDPCQNGGTCSDVEEAYGVYHFHCDCPAGFSGDRCADVAVDATVTCDAETGVNHGVCFMEEDPANSGDMRFYEYRPTSPEYSYAYLYVKSPDLYASGYATLVSSVTFAPAYRCLKYYVAIRTAMNYGVTTNLQVSYTSETNTVPVVLQSIDDTSARWSLRKVTLPEEEDVKIFMKVTKPAGAGIIALINLVVSPGACYVCDSSPCLNGGVCSESAEDFECSCPLGYFGKSCETYVCDPSPCLNQGECEPSSENESGFQCNCMLGYSGDTCDEYVCDPSPCQNGGTCDVSVESPYYECSCKLGYHGANCEHYICDPNPCQNGGTCSPVTDTFHCDCMYGTGGEDCSVSLTTFCSFEDDNCDFKNSPAVNCKWEKSEGSGDAFYPWPERAYSGRTYLHVDSSKNKGKRCQLELRQQFDDRERCLVLFYVMIGAFVESFSVDMNVDGKVTKLWTVSGSKGNLWRHQLVGFSTSSAANTTVQIVATTRHVLMGNIAIDNVQLKPYPCSKIVLCDFENGLVNVPSGLSCVRLNPEVDYVKNWRVRQKPSQQVLNNPFTRTTGPSASRSGFRYAFIDSSYNVDATMEIKHTFTGRACVSIGYHMFGSNIGTLYVKLANADRTQEIVAWSKSGNQGDEWHYYEFDIESITNKRIIITADKGYGMPADEGDIAIDDIVVVNQPCESE
ncbi:neurogenic locus notch homolog protein 1-like [Pecten maximus]|uniref:neurogenic locus notch homolog protein 1-like n=1 Tax=Pecten maximus TaxID=6579 RepID=UPI001458B99B|nr:neurogenic locus notch homolog protein 1-like [Pecten maximus]